MMLLVLLCTVMRRVGLEKTATGRLLAAWLRENARATEGRLLLS